MLCDDTQLSTLLVLPSDGASLAVVTEELCELSDGQLLNLTSLLLQEIDISALITIVRSLLLYEIDVIHASALITIVLDCASAPVQ